MTENHYFCMGCGATIQTENPKEIQLEIAKNVRKRRTRLLSTLF